MIHIVLDGNCVTSEEEFHETVCQGLNFPSYYGRNLAALRDVLLSDDRSPIEIEWKHSAASKEAMGRDFLRIKSVLEDLATERGNLHVSFL